MAYEPLYLARYESRHWVFDGAAPSEQAAINVCIQGLKIHAQQCELQPDWWYADFHDNERDAETDRGLFQVRKLEVGGAYRDREPLA